MKTIITSIGNTINSQFDLRFGRAEWYCLFDDNNIKSVEFFKNEYANNTKNSGIKNAKKLIDLKVEKIISGEFGEKTKIMLDNANIQIVIINNHNYTINNILNKLNISNIKINNK